MLSKDSICENPYLVIYIIIVVVLLFIIYLLSIHTCSNSDLNY